MIQDPTANGFIFGGSNELSKTKILCKNIFIFHTWQIYVSESQGLETWGMACKHSSRNLQIHLKVRLSLHVHLGGE